MTESLRRTAAAVLLPGFVGPRLPEWVADALREGLGGVCLFGSNVQDPQQLRALTDAIRALQPAAVVAVDEEGGDVTRLHVPDGSPEPGNGVLGRIDDLAATTASARAIGHELVAAGVTLDLAPTVDVNTNPENPVIGARSFSDVPEVAARHSAAWVRGLQSTGVAACAKHFPGHGDTAVDSHLGLPVVDRPLESLRSTDLVPFVAAIQAGVAAVMTSHIVLPQLDPDSPATTSRRILAGLLRDDLGFSGAIVTDALDMAGASGAIGIPEAAVRALAAGADLLCLGSDSEQHLQPVLDAVVAAVEDGRLPVARLLDAATRVRALAPPVAPSGPEDPRSGSAGVAAQAGLEDPPPESARVAAPAGPEDPRPESVRVAAQAGLEDPRPDDAGLHGPARPDSPARFEGPRLESARVAASFDVSPKAAALLARPGEWTVVQLQAQANVAVGEAGWGPFAAAAADPGSRAARRFAGWRHVDVDVDASGPLPAVDGRVLVIGRDVHRHPHARAVVDGLRAAREPVLVVDMGWPSADRGYADVATFGGSRAVGAALLLLLTTMED